MFGFAKLFTVGALGSFFAGCVATAIVAVFSQPLVKVAGSFQSPDYFGLLVFGMVAAVVLAQLFTSAPYYLRAAKTGFGAVDPELEGAARLDGAGRWQLFRHLTVPLVGPASFFLLIMNVIYSFQVFDIVFVLTGGGPRNATTVLVTYAYEERSPWFVLGFAVACALGSVYGFLQGAWPFGVVEAIWSVVALRRWWTKRASAGLKSTIAH